MPQLGFELTAAQSGFITVAPAIGAFAMKRGSRIILRRFSFRRSLTVFGLLATADYASCACFGRAGRCPRCSRCYWCPAS